MPVQRTVSSMLKRKKSRSAPYKKKPSAKVVAAKSHNQGIVARGKSHTANATKYGPFPARRTYTFSYQNGATLFTPGTATGQCVLKCNSLFDIDLNLGGPFGNHLPTDYGRLLSTTGPYRDYKVLSWDIEITLINQSVSPLAGYLIGSSGAYTDWDTLSECQLFPPAEPFFMSGVAGNSGVKVIKTNGNVSDIFTFMGDIALIGPATGDPAALVYGGLYLYSTDGTNVNVSLAIRVRQRAELSNVDGSS